MNWRSSAVLLLIFVAACAPELHGPEGESVAMEPEAEDHGHPMGAEQPHMHSHGTHELREAEEPHPTVKLTVHEDPKAGWNLQIATENFIWSPLEASGEHVAGHGHAHLYIDGVKINRLYGEWQHIPELTPGSHHVEVTLNSNSHEDLAVDGKRVSDTAVIVAR